MMGIILGFGSRERQVQQDVKQAVMDGVRAGRDVGDILQKWNDEADAYDKCAQEAAPERYTSIWYYGDALHFHHVNRRHPFSPDGWAALEVHEPFPLPEDEEEA